MRDRASDDSAELALPGARGLEIREIKCRGVGVDNPEGSAIAGVSHACPRAARENAPADRPAQVTKGSTMMIRPLDDDQVQRVRCYRRAWRRRPTELAVFTRLFARRLQLRCSCRGGNADVPRLTNGPRVARWPRTSGRPAERRTLLAPGTRTGAGLSVASLGIIVQNLHRLDAIEHLLGGEMGRAASVRAFSRSTTAWRDAVAGRVPRQSGPGVDGNSWRTTGPRS